jgi:RTX calcium-binding nonapeptide repeat (4 copies)
VQAIREDTIMSRFSWTMRAAILAALAGLAFAALAAQGAPGAQAASWQCAGSAASVSLAGATPIAPVVAAPVPGCADTQTGLENLAQSLGLPASLLQARTASAITSIDPDGGPSASQRVGAIGRVEGLTLTLSPTAVLRVGVAQAQATGACVHGAPALAGTSQLASVTLNGVGVSLDALAAQLGALLAPLSRVVDLKVNEQAGGGSSLTQRALHLRILTTAGTPLLDVIAGEARVGVDGAVCAGAASTAGGETELRPCPRGSELNAARGLCVIHVAAQGGQGASVIIVGRPFEGPSGGTVVALVQARKRLRSACLRGAGPRYAVVGTRRGDRITGTNRADRILGLAGRDSLDGGRGADCIDGGSARDVISGGEGSDRLRGGTGRDVLDGGLGRDTIHGGSGNDYLTGGNDSDRLWGERGRDAINAGFGADRVAGGPQRDIINIATAGPPARVDCGSGHDTVRMNNNERRRVRRCEIRYVLRDGETTRR